MIHKRQYIRLTIVLLIPLLALGWWLASEEVLLPRHHVIFCEEFSSRITCNSVEVRKDEADNLLRSYGAVRLWGARLGGFHHPIVSLGLSEIPPVDRGINKTLTLPPRSIKDNPFASCEIFPVADTISVWSYSCMGGDWDGDRFYFQDEQTDNKFREAVKLIDEESAKNEKLKTKALSFSLLAPFIIYFLLSLSFFLLIKIFKYVIYGHKKKTA